MEKCQNCPLRDHSAECFAQKTKHVRFCQLVEFDPGYRRLVWQRSTDDPVPSELQPVEPIEPATTIVPVEPAQEPVKVEPSSLSGPPGQTAPSKGCGCGERKPLVDRQRPKAITPEEQEAHRKRVQNLWNERMKQKRKKP